MPAGTIALTNNSATVTGTGTSFTTELKVNDFLVSTVGGVAYTLGVKSIESNTSLTLLEKFTGPTASGQSWTPVPYGTMAAITAQVAAQVTYAIRGFNLDKANWQQIFTGTGTVTVTLPDGTSWQGPAWNGIATALDGKANLVNDVVEVAHGGTGQKNLSGVMTWLGLGDAAFKNTGTAAGTLAAGNDNRFSTVDGNSGGLITSPITVNGPVSVSAAGNYAIAGSTLISDSTGYTARFALISGSSSTYDVQIHYRLVNNQYHCVRFIQAGIETFRAQSNGACYAVSFNPTSDSNLKFNKRFIDNPILKYVSLRGMTYELNGDRKAGIIAQDAEKFLPESVSTNPEPVVLEDGTILPETKSLDYGGTSAAGVEAYKALFPLLLKCLENSDEAKEDIKKIIAATNYSTDDANETDMKMEWALLNPPISSKNDASQIGSDSEQKIN